MTVNAREKLRKKAQRKAGEYTQKARQISRKGEIERSKCGRGKEREMEGRKRER